LYEFGKFRCDPREHLLLRGNTPVSLSPKCFEILIVLLQSNGKLLTKDELMRQVWPDSFVEEANLTVHISALRKVFGETAEGDRYIETVPKSGYRFVASVKEEQKRENPEPLVAQPGTGTIEPSLAEAPTSERWDRRWSLGIVSVLILIAGIVLWVSQRRPRFTDKDTVVLADFANTTGDPVFDGALRQGLSSQLEQSPYLNLMSEERIAQTLVLMAQSKESRLTHDLALEVCQRTGSTAILRPTISQVGTQYVLTLKAINCSNSESLGSAEAQAVDKDHVLDALGRVAASIRNQLGESLTSVQKYDAPAENVTTPSLEALKAYSLGYKALVLKAEYTAAIPLFQRAISLDPNFAMAYARLGTSYFNVYETLHAAEYARKAYELRDRVSEREKLYIASHFELIVTGNLEAARRIYELSSQTYPHDIPLNNLGVIYSELGDFDRALSAYQNVLRVSTGTGNRYANLANGYIQLNRLEEAKATAQEARSHNIDSPELHLSLYWVAFLQRDATRMEAEAAELINRPGHEDKMLNYEADTALYFGQMGKARAFTRRAIDSAQKADHKEASALFRADAAIREALVGNMELAKQNANAALAQSKGRDVVALSAISLKLAGDSASAKRLKADLEKRFPLDTLVQSTYLPALRTMFATGTKASDDDIAPTDRAAVYEFGGNLETVNFVFYPVYLKGQSYLAANDGVAAAVEFQKILDHPGAVRSEPIGALAHLQLGRALLKSGDKTKAKVAYQEFLTLWNNPDVDTPVLRDAKSEYLKIN
jgi:eukaryotic-like serine/threonine-protein kinase